MIIQIYVYNFTFGRKKSRVTHRYIFTLYIYIRETSYEDNNDVDVFMYTCVIILCTRSGLVVTLCMQDVLSRCRVCMRNVISERV